LAKTFFIIVLFATLFVCSAQAGPTVLALQSVDVAPYEQAIQGFEHIYGAEVKRLFISDLKEKDLLKTVRESRPDLVLAVGRDALLSARRITTIPVVYCMVLHPRSFLSGEKNISGVSMNLPPEQQLSELLKVLPAARNVGLLYNPDHSSVFVQGVRSAAGRMNVNLMATAVRRSGDVPSLLNTMKGKAGVFWMLPDITVVTPETIESILLFSLENNIPILTFSEKYLELGAMLAIGIDPFDVGAQAGEMAQKIFSGGITKENRHVDARKALLSVNLGIARKLGIAIDQKVIRGIKVVR